MHEIHQNEPTMLTSKYMATDKVRHLTSFYPMAMVMIQCFDEFFQIRMSTNIIELFTGMLTTEK